MSVTPASPFVAPPRISAATFERVLREAGSPWADRATELYRLIADNGHDPAVYLAIAGKEHTYGTNRNSVLWRNDTRSWTNARTVRDPSLTGWEIVRDPMRGSNYVRYADVTDSLEDGMYRVTDPTYRYAREGRTTLEQVFAIWTEGDGPQYTAFVVDAVNRYIEMDIEPMATAQIPGFVWAPAATDHFDRGRTERIRGGAQHYTAGTNSLGWLTQSSKPPVSATFLVRHEPTMESRGWQLVRIEDTAWTTAFANPYTVSIEYEHKAGQPISDTAYEVLAQTWADITRYVQAHNLGSIDVVRGHREWVNNPSLVCPDGIDVARIERRRRELLTDSAPPASDPLAHVELDPWRDHIGGNPYGRSFYIPTVFVHEIRQHDWHVTGHCVSGAFAEGDALVQYFERARLEWRDGMITRGLVGRETLESRFPERVTW